MNEIIDLYSFMIDKTEIVNKIANMDEESFSNNYDLVLAGYSIIEGIKERLLKVNRDVFLLSSVLNELSKEFYHFSKMIVNYYSFINRSMIYDYCKLEFKVMLDEISNILKGS